VTFFFRIKKIFNKFSRICCDPSIRYDVIWVETSQLIVDIKIIILSPVMTKDCLVKWKVEILFLSFNIKHSFCAVPWSFDSWISLIWKLAIMITLIRHINIKH
jgi:hypothetical protein